MSLLHVESDKSRSQAVVPDRATPMQRTPSRVRSMTSSLRPMWNLSLAQLKRAGRTTRGRIVATQPWTVSMIEYSELDAVTNRRLRFAPPNDRLLVRSGNAILPRGVPSGE